jgi:hypothetical protein
MMQFLKEKNREFLKEKNREKVIMNLVCPLPRFNNYHCMTLLFIPPYSPTSQITLNKFSENILSTHISKNQCNSKHKYNKFKILNI